MLTGLYSTLSKRSLIISLIFLAGMLAMFYPAKSVNVDEQEYLRNASLILQGGLRQQCDGGGTQFEAGDYCISKYNIGTSIFLIPAAAINPEIAFAITFCVFAVGVFVFHKFLISLRISTVFTYLYALFPAFVYYSRTLMSETFSATLILIVAYCLWREQALPALRWGVAAGTAAGLAVLVRYTNVLPIGLLLLVIYLPALYRHSLRDIFVHIASLAAGGLPWLLVFVSVNSYLYGSPFRSGYFFSGEEGVYIASQVPIFLARFGGGLSLIYPLMLELPVLIRTRLSALLIPVIATAVFYAGFPNTTFEGRPLDLILGFRFLVPVIPLLLLAYASSLHKWEDRGWFRPLMSLAVIGLMAVSVLLSYQHQQFLLG